eukprot:7386574-Prymnesium_polylepis.1
MRARRCAEAAPDAENGETSDLKVSAESSRRGGDAPALPRLWRRRDRLHGVTQVCDSRYVTHCQAIVRFQNGERSKRT